MPRPEDYTLAYSIFLALDSSSLYDYSMRTTVDTLVNLYLNELRDKEASKSTISNYRICLTKFCDLFGHKSPEGLNEDSLRRFNDYLSLKNTKDVDSYTLRHIKPLQYFLLWCEKNGYETGLSSNKVYEANKRLQSKTYKKQRSYDKPYISRRELQKLDNYWRKDDFSSRLYALRNRAIVAVLGDTGIKVSELMSLSRNDYKEKYLSVRSRKLPLEASTVNILNEYLKIRPDNTEPMFVAYSSLEADKIVAQPLSTRGIQRIVKYTAEEVGIKGNISPQILRNSRIIQVLAENDMDYNLLTYYFGLSDINTSYQRFITKAQELSKSGEL